MSLNVVVSSVDGKYRVPVIINANQPLRDIIPLALAKLKVPNADASTAGIYGLRHGRHELDLATIARLSGLAPGAKLDLILLDERKAKHNASTPVSVALQVEGQPRITGTIMSSTPLLQGISDIFNGRHQVFIDGRTPHLLVMGQEVFGLEKLANTSLSDLGVKSGSCLIRMTSKSESGMTSEKAQFIIESCRNNRADEPIAASVSEKQQESDMIEIPPANCTSTLLEANTPSAPTQNTFDRQIRLFAPPSKTSNTPDLPDEFYEPSEMDCRLQMSSLQTRTQSLMNAPLVSHAKMLEKKQKELLSKHPTTILRFRFPDHHQLEAVFQSTEMGRDLHLFLLDHCLNVSQVTLTVGMPPKAISSNEKKQLWQLDLVPGAILNVFTGEKHKGLGTAELLRPDFLQKPVPLPIPSDPTIVLPQSATNDVSNTTVPTIAAPPASSSNTLLKKPKWLRL